MGLAKEAFELAYAQLRGQKADLQNLRNQASICAAVSGLIASVFASLVLSSGGGEFIVAEGGFLGFSLIGVIVLALFSGSIGFAVMAVIGWKTCTFDINPGTIAHAHEFKRSESELWISLAQDAMRYFHDNEHVLDNAKNMLRFSLMFAFAQIPAWIVVAF